MNDFQVAYIPVGVPTFDLEHAERQFELSKKMLSEISDDFAFPGEMLLTIDKLTEFLDGISPDIIVFQNLTFANAAYMAEVIKRFDCPILLWTLREPVIDGSRLRLNSLTGAYSAANIMCMNDMDEFTYVFGSPEEDEVKKKIGAFVKAAHLKQALEGLKIASVGGPPQGFDFGSATDDELKKNFGAGLVSIEASELMDRANSYSEAECEEFSKRSFEAMTGLDATPKERVLGHARLYKAYTDYIKEVGVEALASRCWPDFFTEYGTPVCGVLSMLNDDGIASSCEADVYGALSMWIGMQLSGEPVFFGDPVSMDEEENTITFWHCGAAACSLARKDTGAVVGVHPNRKIGPAMDFGCEAFPEATVFRVGKDSDGDFRFFITEGSVPDKPKQFTGTSIVFEAESDVADIVSESITDGFEPHFIIIKGHHADTLEMLADMLGFDAYIY